MTTSQRFKCVPQILRLLSIHIFKLLFKLIAYSFRSICRQASEDREERNLFDVGEMYFFC